MASQQVSRDRLAVSSRGVLVLKKKGVSANYRLYDGDRELGVVESDGSWRTGSIDLDGRSIRFSAPVGAETATATVDGVEVAAAHFEGSERSRELGHGLFVEVRGGGGDGDLILRGLQHGFGQKPYDFTTLDGAEVGSAALRGWAGRRIEIDVDDTLSFPVRVFIGWLVTRAFNQVAGGRNTAG